MFKTQNTSILTSFFLKTRHSCGQKKLGILYVHIEANNISNFQSPQKTRVFRKKSLKMTVGQENAFCAMSKHIFMFKHGTCLDMVWCLNMKCERNILQFHLFSLSRNIHAVILLCLQAIWMSYPLCISQFRWNFVCSLRNLCMFKHHASMFKHKTLMSKHRHVMSKHGKRHVQTWKFYFWTWTKHV